MEMRMTYSGATSSGTVRTMQRPISIMLIDDDADTLEMFRAQPHIKDTLLVVKRGGIEALKELDHLNYRIDAVVTDLSMSDINGMELTGLIREQESLRGKSRPIDIYWLTGWPPDDKTLGQAKKDLNVKEWLEKPYDVRQLVEKVIHNIEEDKIHLTQ